MYLHLPHQTTPKRPFFCPGPAVFSTFDFEMCFGPQWRALFRHLNFQKCFEAGVLCTCWLRNGLRATAACTFATSQLPKAVREWFGLYILTSKYASRHNGVHFCDISTSKSGLKLTCFVHCDVQLFLSHPAALASLLFDPPESQMLRNTFLPFRSLASSVFWFFLFSCLLSSSLFFSDSSHLCFVICPYCWKFDF